MTGTAPTAGGAARIRRGCGAAPLLAAVLAACGAADRVDDQALLDDARAGRPAEVTVQGPVVRVLADLPAGRDGPHQRFDVDVSGLVVEVDHNLELAPRAPVQVGTMVTIHGQFEPDPGRPVIHQTHHSTGGHEGGWIEVDGQRFE